MEDRLLLAAPDVFEPDNTPDTASTIVANGPAPTHSLHGVGTDVDWLRFTLSGTASDVAVEVTPPRFGGLVAMGLYSDQDLTSTISEDHEEGILRAYALPPGTYLVRTSWYEDVEAYTIAVTATPPVPAIERLDHVRLAGEGFNSLQYSPSGQLTQLLWFDDKLTYRVRAADGSFSEEPVATSERWSFGGLFSPRDSNLAQLLVQSDGTPHVLLAAWSDAIDHYRRDGSGWKKVETISVPLRSYDRIKQMAAAIGPDNSLHVFVSSGTVEWNGQTNDTYAVYGTNKTGDWRFEDAVSPAVVSSAPPRDMPYFRTLSLAVDSRNDAHVAYTPAFLDYGQPPGPGRPFSQLAYATNKTGNWVSQVVHQPPDDSGDSGRGASIAIGPDDQPAIAQFYVDRVATGSPSYSRLLYHKRQSDGSWTTETVASSPDGYVAGDGANYTGFAPHLLFDDVGRPHIAFSDYASEHIYGEANEFAGQIRHAVKNAGTWRLETVYRQTDPLRNQMIFPTMAISFDEIAFTGLRQVQVLDAGLFLLRNDSSYVFASRPQTALRSFTRQNPADSLTSVDGLVFRATFSVAVQNVDAADFVVFGTTTATVTGVSAVSPSVYDVAVSGGDLADFNGLIGLDLSTGQNITDLAGNAVPTREPATDETYTVDNTPPVLASFTRQHPMDSPTAADALVFRATFSEAVQDVDAADFVVLGATTATVTGVSAVSSRVYDVGVSGGNLANFNGLVGLDLRAGQNITDLAENALSAHEPATDETYSVDNAPPRLTGLTRQSPATRRTRADALVFRATFSEAVQNVDAADFAVLGTTTATVTGVSAVDPRGYEVTVSGGDLANFNGFVGLDLRAGQNIVDLAGHPLPPGEPAIDEMYAVNNPAGLPFAVGVAGDSLSDEYFEESYDYAKNWVELLSSDVNVGPQGQWGEPRRDGFQFNWARAGATSTTLLADGQHTGLAQQIATGLIDYAVLTIGQNDFGPWTAAYLGIYNGIWTPTQIEAYVNQVVANIETALHTLDATGRKLVLANVIDYGVAPATRIFLPDPSKRELVTNVLRGVNSQVLALAKKYEVPLIDGFQATQDLLGTNHQPATTVSIGGAAFTNDAGAGPQHLFVDDGIHPHTVGQAVIANLVVEAIRLGYGQEVASLAFTERELLELAGLGGQYVADTLRLDYARYVLLPKRWQNPLIQYDVTGEGQVFAIDALTLIDYINAHPDDRVVPAAPAVPPPFYDVTGDDLITPVDVLTVIDYINSHPGSGEGEPTTDAASAAPVWTTYDSVPDQVTTPRRITADGFDGRGSGAPTNPVLCEPRWRARRQADFPPPDPQPRAAPRRGDAGEAGPDMLGGEYEEALGLIADDVAGAWSAAVRGL